MSQPLGHTGVVEVPQRDGGRVLWAIGPLFLGVAAYFLFVAPPADVPLNPMNIVERERFAPGARRQPMASPPSVMIGGFDHRCNECHKTFDSPPVERRTLTQHTAIRFDHGMNNRCFNCHDRDDRERFSLYAGGTIGFDQVQRLCSQCHGTVYRDWQRGTHGKTMGSWDRTGGKQVRLECNDCHDPHAPAYPRIVPLPSPDTLRMGDQSPHEEAPGEHGRHIPLRRWSSPERHENVKPTAGPGPAPTEGEHSKEGRP